MTMCPSPALIVPDRAMPRPLSGLRGPASLLVLVAWLWTVAHSHGVGAGTKRPYVSLEDILPCPLTGLHNCSTLKHAHTIGHWAHSNHTHNHTHSLGPDDCVTAGGLRYLAVVSRHGARYPTKKKMAMARQAASLLCAHPSLTPHLQHQHPQALTWCARLLSALEGAVPGGLAALGEDEQQHWGRTLAATYGPLLVDHQQQAQWRTYVTRKARTKASCDHCTQALRHSLAHPHHPNDSTTPTPTARHQWEADTCTLEAEALLRPYVGCARLVHEREQTLAALFDKSTVLGVAVSRVQSSLGLSVGDPLVTPEVVLGLYFGCQTDLTLFPSDTPLEGGHVGGHSWACGVLGGQVLGELERIEDGENYLTRGFGHSHAREVMAPLMRHMTHSMEQAAQDNTPPVVELFFAHDSTLLPLVALLDVLELGTEPLDSRAARHCPFSSRLVLEMWGCGTLVLRYNGLPVRVMQGGLEQWRHDYRHALSVDTHHICRMPHPQPSSLQEDKDEL